MSTEEIPPQSKARFIEPMLCVSASSLPEGNEWEYKLKLDGYRAVAIKTAGKLLLRSRNDKDFTARYHSTADALKKLPDETIIDGEVVAFDESGRPSFNRLQNYGSSQVPIYYYVFDLPMLAGRDLACLHVDGRQRYLLPNKFTMPTGTAYANDESTSSPLDRAVGEGGIASMFVLALHPIQKLRYGSAGHHSFGR